MDLKTESNLAWRKVDAFVHTFTDFDGTTCTIESDGFDQAHGRAVMLEDLTSLRKLVMQTEWGFDMHFGMCPCTLALTEHLEAYQKHLDECEDD